MTHSPISSLIFITLTYTKQGYFYTNNVCPVHAEPLIRDPGTEQAEDAAHLTVLRRLLGNYI